MGLIDHRVQLANEIIADIEGDRISDEQILYKARRLANLVADPDVEEWLGYELAGYPPSIPERLRPLVSRSRREYSDNPLQKAQVIIESLPRIMSSVIPSLDHAWQHNLGVQRAIARQRMVPRKGDQKIDTSRWEEGVLRVKGQLIRYAGIQKAVRAEVHRFAVAAYHRFAFSEIASAIFEKHQRMVDALLTNVAPDVIEKVPAIYDRLTEGSRDPEAINQAMASCRRMISSFADAVFPATVGASAEIGDSGPGLNKQTYLNRIEQFVRTNTPSESRRERLVKTVRLLNERTSAGLKADITPDEARALFVLTYITLGEIASLKAKADADAEKH